MSAGTLSIGLIATATLIGGCFLIARKIGRVGNEIDAMFAWGDVPALPAEAKRPGGNGSGGRGNKTHRVETHEGSPCRTDRRGVV